MKIVLIRHGATAGNIKKRYIGITDEDLCASGIESIHNNIKAGYYQGVQAVYVSPMKRCRQTAELIYPEYKQHIVPDFRECDLAYLKERIIKNFLAMSSTRDGLTVMQRYHFHKEKMLRILRKEVLRAGMI